MNKICFIFSGISTFIGIITLITTTILNKVIPKLGRIAFQSAMKGTFGEADYYMNFTGINLFAFSLIKVNASGSLKESEISLSITALSV